jgi:hypothetical protein
MRRIFFIDILNAMNPAAPDGAQSKNPFGFFSRLIPSEFVAPRRINYRVL